MTVRSTVLLALLSFCAFAPCSAEAPVMPARPRPVVAEPRQPTVVLPAIVDGKPTRELTQRASEDDRDYRLVLDLTPQVLRFDTPKHDEYRDDLTTVEQGDTMVVTAASARLQRGRNVLTRLPEGTVLPAGKRQDDWITTAVVQDGRQIVGWIKADDVTLKAVEPELAPTLSNLVRGEFASLGLLIQKCKWFDDGLYAATDLAAQEGLGEFGGKRAMLAALATTLAAADPEQIGPAELVVLAAAKLGGLELDLPTETQRRLDDELNRFGGSARRAKPLGFYTWTDELSAIFRQDRMLQTPLDPPLHRLAQQLHDDADVRATYEGYLQLVARLTNSLSRPELRPALAALDADQQPEFAAGTSFFPPSRSRETDLVMQLYGDRPIPPGFNLADEMIERIRDGRMDLTPDAKSGWYEYQTWPLEGLVTPEQMPEAAHARFGDRYRKTLVELFKGAYALTRETHVKQLDIAEPAAAAPFFGPEPPPKPKLRISPELSGEPLPSYFVRRAQSYRFVRDVLVEAFGEEALSQMHRQTPEGPVEANLADELAHIEALCFGGYVTLSRQLGMTVDASQPLGSGDAAVDADRFRHWCANLTRDADLSRDVRMMVPVFHDLGRDKTKVWALLGWQEQRLRVHFHRAPKVEVFDDTGALLAEDRYELQLRSEGFTIVTPVTAEFYVDGLLNRKEFRQVADTYRTKTAILAHLAAPE